MQRILAALGCAAALLAIPSVGLADASGATMSADSIDISGPVPPVWRVSPPSTDPSPPAVQALGINTVRGTLLHGEGDLLLVALDGAQAVVRIPGGGLDQLASGATVEAVGLPTAVGILDAWRVRLQP